VTTAVEARGLCKRYGPLAAVDGLSFALERGEVMGVLGPNGAGKTTAVRVLTTILEPDAGSFSVAGVPHGRPAEIRRRIGVLPESGGYPERQTGEEYLRYHARLYGRRRAAARSAASTLLEEVGLLDRGGSLIASYSRGMRQRLGIARALLNEPEVVFLDEPTLGLDPAGQRQVLAHVRAIARERGAAVLLSTHLLTEVEECCSRVLILDRGRAIAHGTVDEVVRLAGAARSARLRVPPGQATRAEQVLVAVAGVARVEAGDGPAGTLVVEFGEASAGPARLSEAVGALLHAGVELVACELEGARLSDAFLAITGGDRDA
jgi:ABC-2 type transport system ATP-binding protein